MRTIVDFGEQEATIEKGAEAGGSPVTTVEGKLHMRRCRSRCTHTRTISRMPYVRYEMLRHCVQYVAQWAVFTDLAFVLAPNGLCSSTRDTDRSKCAGESPITTTTNWTTTGTYGTRRAASAAAATWGECAVWCVWVKLHRVTWPCQSPTPDSAPHRLPLHRERSCTLNRVCFRDRHNMAKLNIVAFLGSARNRCAVRVCAHVVVVARTVLPPFCGARVNERVSEHVATVGGVVVICDPAICVAATHQWWWGRSKQCQNVCAHACCRTPPRCFQPIAAGAKRKQNHHYRCLYFRFLFVLVCDFWLVVAASSRALQPRVLHTATARVCFLAPLSRWLTDVDALRCVVAIGWCRYTVLRTGAARLGWGLASRRSCRRLSRSAVTAWWCLIRLSSTCPCSTVRPPPSFASSVCLTESFVHCVCVCRCVGVLLMVPAAYVWVSLEVGWRRRRHPSERWRVVVMVAVVVVAEPHFYYKPGEAPEQLDTIANQLANADAVLIISGEYNHSIPPALSNLLDHFGGTRVCGVACPQPWAAWKLCAASTDPSGGWACVRVCREQVQLEAQRTGDVQQRAGARWCAARTEFRVQLMHMRMLCGRCVTALWVDPTGLGWHWLCVCVLVCGAGRHSTEECVLPCSCEPSLASWDASACRTSARSRRCGAQSSVAL